MDLKSLTPHTHKYAHAPAKVAHTAKDTCCFCPVLLHMWGDSGDIPHRNRLHHDVET